MHHLETGQEPKHHLHPEEEGGGDDLLFEDLDQGIQIFYFARIGIHIHFLVITLVCHVNNIMPRHNNATKIIPDCSAFRGTSHLPT